MKLKQDDGVRKLPSGRYSIPCGNCGKRHVQKYSDDNVWCQACRAWCGETGHTPNDDEATECFICGQSGLPTPPPEEFKDCPTCHGEGQIKVAEKS